MQRFQVVTGKYEEYAGKRFQTVLVWNGFKILDSFKNQLDMAFYFKESEAQKYADRLNSLLPQVPWTPKKKEN